MRIEPEGYGMDPGSLDDLEACYELCRRIQKAYSKTYYVSTRLFPREVRPRVQALYAFMRCADEIVDRPGESPPEERLDALEDYETEALGAMAGERTDDPVLRAFADTARRCGIDPADVESFMKSMKMDTHTFRYPTYEDLQEYVYGSAAVVGLMMCRIMGVADDRARAPAGALGVAMQLSNFLRDVAEDWERGRIYIPLEDLERFGYTEEDLARGAVDERFVALMRFEMERTRRIYALADEGMRYIPRGSRFPVIVARRLYSEILDRIEEAGYDVFSRRPDTPLPRKLAVAVSCAARNPSELFVRFPLPGGMAIATPS